MLLSDEPCKLSLVDGTAFFWPDTDISAYVGTEGSYTPYIVEITDDAGKVAIGYLGAVGGGKTLGSELTTNGNMETDDNWQAVNTPTTFEQSTDQKHGGLNSWKFTVDAQFEGIEPKDADKFSLTIGVLYEFDCWVYPDDTTTCRIGVNDSSGWIVAEDKIGLDQDGWNNITRYCTCAGSTVSGYVVVASPTAQVSGTWYNDDFSFKPVTDCPATALKVVSALDGSTHNWTSIETGFDYNQADYDVSIAVALIRSAHNFNATGRTFNFNAKAGP